MNSILSTSVMIVTKINWNETFTSNLHQLSTSTFYVSYPVKNDV